MAASFNGHREVVQALLAKGAQVNAQDSNGVTALILASLQGHIEVVQALLDKGADVNAKANDGGTARMVACFNGHRDVAQTLLDKGAKVNDGETALTVARDADVRALLLQAGAKS
jgi:ankyrin repeat protein